MPRYRSRSSSRSVRATQPLRQLQKAIIETLEVRQLLSVSLNNAGVANLNAAPASVAVPAVPVASDSFSISVPDTANTGQDFQFTVTALDSENDTDPSFSGTINFTSTAAQSSFPSNVTLTDGVGTFTGMLNSPGQQTITATSTNPNTTGTSAPIQVSVVTTELVVRAQSTATFGAAISFTVTAEDNYGNTDTGFSDNVDFESSDPNAILPYNQASLTNGTGTFSAQLFCPGHQTISAYDDNDDSGEIDSVAATVKVTVYPLIVNNTGGQLDDDIEPNALTLPDAVEMANFQTAYTNITFDPTVFPSGSGTTIYLGNTLDISQRNAKVTISGLGSSTVDVDGDGEVGVFSIDEHVTAAINGLSITGGFGLGGEGPLGSGVYNAGNLTLTNDAVDNNFGDSGGGIFSYMGSTLDIVGGEVVGNGSYNSGGGIYTEANTTTLDDVYVGYNGSNDNAIGGGIFLGAGTLTIEDGSNIDSNNSNSPNFAGGGIAVAPDFGNVKLVLTDSTVQNNSSLEGGGIYLYCDLPNSTVTAVITTSTIANNNAFGAEGSAGDGGGILIAPVDNIDPPVTNVTINSSTISGNYANKNGGGIAIEDYYHQQYSSLTVTNSTISGNTAGNNGGGVFAYGVSMDDGDGGDGGDEPLDSVGDGSTTDLTLTSDTISNNTANANNSDGDGTYGGGLYVYMPEGSQPTITDTIISGNFSGNASTPDDVYGWNGGSGLYYNLIGGNALLAPLGEYGGPTETMALLPGSPAIDAIDGGATNVDQRGISRPQGEYSDIGAFESQGFTIQITGGGQQSAPVDTEFGNSLSIQVTANDPGLTDLSGGQITFTSLPNGDDDSGATFDSDLDSTIIATLASDGTASVDATANDTTGTYTVSATASGIQSPANFSLANVDYFVVTANDEVTAGDQFDFTVTAYGTGNNPDPNYSGEVEFTSTDPQASLPDVTLVNGSGDFPATLETAGPQYITATDTDNVVITGTSNQIQVDPGTATQYIVSAPDNANAGQSFQFTVTAEDQFGNVTEYGGEVHFTSSDPLATLPEDSSVDDGTDSFDATLDTAGDQTITASSTGNDSVQGTSGSIDVSAGDTTQYVISAPTGATAGQQFEFTVTSEDQFGNVSTTDCGPLVFSSTDPNAVLPTGADLMLSNGTGDFDATLKTSGNQTISVGEELTSLIHPLSVHPSLIGGIQGTSNSIDVSAAGTVKYVVSAPNDATAGQEFEFTVTAEDQYGNISSTYGGPLHFTSSDPMATLPPEDTLSLTNGQGTFDATLDTAGNQSITVGQTGPYVPAAISNQIAVSAAQVSKYVVSAPGAETAGNEFQFTVTAKDPFGNTAAASYGGPLHFTSSDPLATLPVDTTLVNGFGTFDATLDTAGNQTITATNSSFASITGTSHSIDVGAGQVETYVVTAPSNVPAGQQFLFLVKAEDAWGNIAAVQHGGLLQFTSSDGLAVLPVNTSDAALDIGDGEREFDATLETAGDQTITVTNSNDTSITGTSGDVDVSAGQVTKYVVSAPANATAGQQLQFTVTAEDQFGNTATAAYGGPLHFTSSDPLATLPIDTTLVNGFGTFEATLDTAGDQTIQATNSSVGSVSGTSNSVDVSAEQVTKYVVSAPGAETAGHEFQFTVTAEDPFGNTATAPYGGPLHFTSNDPLATLPVNTTLVNGFGTFEAILDTAGNQTITATNSSVGTLTGNSGNVLVTAAAANHFVISAPSPQTAGNSFDFTVTAEDPFGNLASGYNGTLHFTANDPLATLPANSTLVNGAGAFIATLDLAGGRAITASDTVSSGITGSSNLITVNAAAASNFIITAPSPQTAGNSFNFTITAIDPYGNTAKGYTGTVHFTSSDSAASLPSDTTLTNGAGLLSATLKTAGPQTIRATDTALSTIIGISNSILVNASVANHFVVSAPSAATAGSPFNFTITAEDKYNNLVSGYTGTVHFTSTDGLATLPANSTLTNGVGTFSATLQSSGSITATDTVTSTITGTSNLISVGAITHFALVVNDAADRLDGSISAGDLTLRDAISLADSWGGAQNITFDPTAFPTTGTTITLTLGDLELSDTTGKVTIVGPGARALTISGGNSSSIFQVDPNVTAEIDNVTLTAGSSVNGGAILNHGTLILSASEITNSAALVDGGGIFSDGSLTISFSTLSGNKAAGGAGAYIAGTGGSISSSTFYNNTASSQGGGVEIAAPVTIYDSTITANTSGAGAGIFILQGNVVTLYNTIVAGNLLPNGTTSSTTTPLAGSVNPASAYNVIGNLVPGLTTGVNGNQLNVSIASLALGVLGNNGGLTDTVPLLPGSVAIDKGSNSLIPAGITHDQRGGPRIENTTVDVGAYEVQPVSTTVTLTASAGPYQTGVAVTFNAKINVPAGSPAAVGNVNFYNGTILIGSFALSANVAFTNVTFTAVGSYSIKAVFAGDGVHLGNTSNTLTVGVIAKFLPPTPKADTATTTPGAAVTINVLANDTDPNKSALTITDISTAPADGIATIVNGEIKYTPYAGFNATDTFMYEVTDGDGLSATATVTVTIGSGVGVATDPDNHNLTDLDINGTSGNDNIAVTYAGAQGSAKVTINGVNKGTFNFSGRIVVAGEAGNDVITIDPLFTRQAIIHGGAGNDSISGGSGNDILFGDAGNDTLLGNSGGDILVGDAGNDSLNGGSGNDLLIGGTTIYDNIFADFDLLSQELNSIGPTYAAKVAAITNGGGINGSIELNASTVTTEAASSDTLTGGTNQDFFFYNPNKTKPYADIITDLVKTGSTEETTVSVHA